MRPVEFTTECSWCDVVFDLFCQVLLLTSFATVFLLTVRYNVCWEPRRKRWLLLRKKVKRVGLLVLESEELIGACISDSIAAVAL